MPSSEPPSRRGTSIRAKPASSSSVADAIEIRRSSSATAARSRNAGASAFARAIMSCFETLAVCTVTHASNHLMTARSSPTPATASVTQVRPRATDLGHCSGGVGSGRLRPSMASNVETVVKHGV